MRGVGGVETPCSFVGAREIARKTSAVTYQLSWKFQEYTGNDCSIPASRIFLVNLGVSAQIGRVAANTRHVPSSALAACPHLERATIISARSI